MSTDEDEDQPLPGEQPGDELQEALTSTGIQEAAYGGQSNNNNPIQIGYTQQDPMALFQNYAHQFAKIQNNNNGNPGPPYLAGWQQNMSMMMPPSQN